LTNKYQNANIIVLSTVYLNLNDNYVF